MQKKVKNCLTFVICLMPYSIIFFVKSIKWKSNLSSGKRKAGNKKPLTSDIFIYKSLEVLRGNKNVGWIYLLNKGQQNTTTNIRHKTQKIQVISVRRETKMLSKENCPCGQQMPKQLWQRKKGGKYERTEGTTIIYVNNVPLLLIISGKIKQKRKAGGEKHHACHPTNFSYAN